MSRLLCAVDEIPDPGAKGPFAIDGVAVFVVRHGDRVRAFVDSCPHVGAPLEMEPDRFLDLTGAFVLCSLHGAQFEPDSGLCLGGPCRGRSLTAYPVGIHNGKVIATTRSDGV